MSYVSYGSPRDIQYRAAILSQSHNIMASRQDILNPIPYGNQLTESTSPTAHRNRYDYNNTIALQAVSSQSNISVSPQWLLLLTSYIDRLRHFTGVAGYNPSMPGNLVLGVPSTNPLNIGNSNANATTTELFTNKEVVIRKQFSAVYSQSNIYVVPLGYIIVLEDFDYLYSGVPGSIHARPGRFVPGSYPYINSGTPDYTPPVGTQLNTVIIVRKI